MLFVLDDEDEAKYFFNDLVQLIAQHQVLFFPSSFRRAIKYNQKDAANEIARTEVLNALNTTDDAFVITYPEALAEKVMSKSELNANTLAVAVGEKHDFNDLEPERTT